MSIPTDPKQVHAQLRHNTAPHKHNNMARIVGKVDAVPIKDFTAEAKSSGENNAAADAGKARLGFKCVQGIQGRVGMK